MAFFFIVSAFWGKGERFVKYNFKIIFYKIFFLFSFDADSERPQLACCLLHQKLQMLQHCIAVKKRKHRELEACEARTMMNAYVSTTQLTSSTEKSFKSTHTHSTTSAGKKKKKIF